MAVPEAVLTNADLEKMVETSDKWIRERTGISERHIAREGEYPADLATKAALQALQVANLKPTDLDLVICSTSSPEHIFPATACLVQDRIGATRAGAFDLLAACSGFIYALQLGAQSIRSGALRNVLVLGAENLSRFVDWSDRNTCILFGDGAGAFVLQASERPGGVLSAVLHADGSGAELLSLPGGASRYPATEETIRAGKHFIHMEGNEVFRFATRVMAQATREALEVAGLKIEDISLLIPHQANNRIIEAAARGLKLPMEKFVVNVDRYGNTSTASIPIAVCEAVQQGRIQPGDKIVLVGFGAGLTWGALAAEWTGPLPAGPKLYLKRYTWWARLRSLYRRFTRFIEGLIWGRGEMI
jgi:3-oxoacyl-[acyl-carrier-protein] synthase-3